MDGDRGPGCAVAARFAALQERAARLDDAGEPIDSPLRLALAGKVTEIFTTLFAREALASSLEIGAFEAGMSRMAIALKPGIRACAVEANPHVYGRFAREAIHAGVTYLHAAVSDRIGIARMRIPRTIDGREIDPVNPISSLRERSWGEVTYEEVTVSTVTLNALRRMLGVRPPHAVWIDVEGAQLQVIRGGGKVLADTALLFIEIESVPYWKGEALEFEVIGALAPFDLLPLVRDFEAPGQFNVLFVKRGILTRHADWLSARLEGIEALLDAHFARATPAA
ncbi:FkbM family methyltransferase [Paroceanicella profunda]|uniref:FkbM family methyltransferase n=1 Tax=Paroceanicella profunda TaxID=2579971 RepID=A0A5B8FWR9_9RHOB|nr:FkbM family methyltransferase [Paroceanicella profunda]QDL93336.1 FkbM family methyltransferase [Paroceanicella profunda]